MKINKAYKFRLEPNAEQGVMLTQLVDSARFVWNQILAASFEMFAKNEYINAVLASNFDFLKDVIKAITAQAELFQNLWLKNIE